MIRVKWLFMAAVLAAAIYYRGDVIPYFAVSAGRVRVPGGSVFHLKPITIVINILLISMYVCTWISCWSVCELLQV